MRIWGVEFGRVAILVLDYDPKRETEPSKTVTEAYQSLQEHLMDLYEHPGDEGLDVIVLANEELVAKHQKDFEAIGLEFFPNWRNTEQYRSLLREGLRQENNLYLMKDVSKGWPPLNGKVITGYNLVQVTGNDLEIIDRDGKIDIRPKHPAYLDINKTI